MLCYEDKNNGIREKKTNFKTCTTLQSPIASTLNQSLNHMTREKERKRPIDWTFEPYPPEQTELLKEYRNNVTPMLQKVTQR